MMATLSFGCFIAVVLLCWSNVLCYELNSRGSAGGRRELLRRVFSASIAAVGSSPANAVISGGYCASGVGEGCDDLAEGNDFIRSLQARSAENREKNEQAARDAYYMKNYPDWFAAVGKTMVKKPDGSFLLVTDSELAKLKQANKLTLEMPTAMGGQVTDVTQKPILMLKE